MSASQMIESQLLEQVHHVARRARQLRYRKALALSLIVAILISLVAIVPALSGSASLALAVPVICLGGLLSLLSARLSASRSDDALTAARLIEERFPTLNARLLTAMQQIKDAPPAGLGYLQQTVVRQAVEHSEQHRWSSAVDADSLRRATLASGGAAFLLLALLVTCIIAAQPFAASPKSSANLIANPVAPLANTITVEPGDVSIERGSSLIITARFSQTIPASTSLILEGESAALHGAITTRTVPMNASLDDPIVGVRVPSITTDLTYRIAWQSSESSAYRVTVFDYPQLMQADVSLTYPSYTALPVKHIQDTRQVTAVEGTQILWTLKLNKPVASAQLISEAGDTLTLTATAADATLVQGNITLAKTQRYKMELIDDAGRKNKHEVEFVMSALKNRVPDLKLVFPRRDLRVSPLEEALVVAQAFDDFGVKQFGITYSLAGRETKDIILASDLPGKVNHEASHLLSFEAMNAVTDELLSYHFWADDVAPDGQVRRTFSDMFFAEVRPFEEIFREGQAPPASEQQQQQQQGQQQQIAEGIKEQREIISATWNLIRREIGAEPTAAFKADAQAIREAQEAALERMAQVKEKLEDPKSLEHVEAVVQHMADAIAHLAQAAVANDPAALKLALPAEQLAYQALLKLQAREHEVIRSQQQQQKQQGQQQQAGPSQQQLSELELRNQENRYETQKLAQEQQPQEDPQQRETRQALSRLRDLAKRQQDLNEKLKELDLALKEAQTQQEKEELARQLKRLREQQEEMLRDVDELNNRMEQANQNQRQQQEQHQQSQNSKQGEQSKQNESKQSDTKQAAQNEQKQNEKQSPQSLRDQAKSDDTKQQVDEVRKNIREATEALEKGMTSKALAESTRAQRKLEELREEFRKRASGQFAEDVKEMRDDARKLASDQEKLGEKMKQVDKEGPRTLRDKGERKELADKLGDQKEKLQGLTDRMRRVTEEAEASQPLLSKQLYDTLRDADQQRVEQALDVTRQLLDKGFNDEARAVEPQARKGLDDLKNGVEKAADSVVGDEAQALRRARETLDDLARQVDREAPDRQAPQDQQLAQAQQPGKSKGETADPQNQKQNGSKQSQDKQSPDSGKQPGESQGEPGEKSQGQGKQGEGPGKGQSPGEGKGQEPGGGQGKGKAPGKGQPTLLDQLKQADGNSSGGGSGPHGPITGDNFREWSDQLRDVEEMIDDPKLREEVARVRDRAQAMRAEFKRHGKEPQWDDVKKLVADPLHTLRDRLDDELARRDHKRELVPIDRDPVPGQFTDLVREYYEKLGTGERNE